MRSIHDRLSSHTLRCLQTRCNALKDSSRDDCMACSSPNLSSMKRTDPTQQTRLVHHHAILLRKYAVKMHVANSLATGQQSETVSLWLPRKHVRHLRNSHRLRLMGSPFLPPRGRFVRKHVQYSPDTTHFCPSFWHSEQRESRGNAHQATSATTTGVSSMKLPYFLNVGE